MGWTCTLSSSLGNWCTNWCRGLPIRGSLISSPRSYFIYLWVGLGGWLAGLMTRDGPHF